jgi:hypothetical protein
VEGDFVITICCRRINYSLRSQFTGEQGVIGEGMKYEGGDNIQVGDEVSIDTKYKGTVVANIESGEYSILHTKDQWGYLKTGVLIDTDFGGIVHYEKESLITDEVKLRNRA